jgi:hypothetical protein
MIPNDQQANSLKGLFGSFRAEWLQEKLYSLFNEPAYFPSLKDHRPCVLVGGRGTGKTTVLRCMSYEGQFALAGQNFEALRTADFVGLYHRVNTTRVSAFCGSSRSQEEWQRLFSHYVNIEICELLLEALKFYRRHSSSNETLAARTCSQVASAFGSVDVTDEDKLRATIEDARCAIEIHINNVASPVPVLSLLQSPIDLLVEGMAGLEFFQNKSFYIILDEYENYLDYQQIVINTLIKHSSTSYVFKVGVRELGWRIKTTLNSNEQLINPADYELIDIDHSLRDTFTKFARDVCETRLSAWFKEYNLPSLTLDQLLPALSFEEEARLLGVGARVHNLRNYINTNSDRLGTIRNLGDLELFVFLELNKGDQVRAVEELLVLASGSSQKRVRFNNYKYACLFSVAGEHQDIRKYYCGVDVFSKISRNNLRFFLQLVTESIARHIESSSRTSDAISYADQTKAARQIGLRYLTELEGVTVHGVQLVKLILGLGRFFQILASNPNEGSPECNQFGIKFASKTSGDMTQRVSELLRNGIMHLALVRDSGTKLAAASDTREWDYAPHPIFAPFFGFSHRRKRKMNMTEHEIYELVVQPKATIKKLLRTRAYLLEESVPQQLKLFDEYFEGSDA